jgi:hypothetical protein
VDRLTGQIDSLIGRYQSVFDRYGKKQKYAQYYPCFTLELHPIRIAIYRYAEKHPAERGAMCKHILSERSTEAYLYALLALNSRIKARVLLSDSSNCNRKLHNETLRWSSIKQTTDEHFSLSDRKRTYDGHPREPPPTIFEELCISPFH